MKDFGGMMKQAQKMQADMQKIQEEIQNMEIVGESGAGLVKVTMTGRHDVRSVSIDPSLKEERLEMIEDLVAAAVNDAVRKVQSVTSEKMSSMTGGLQMPPGFDFKF